MSRWHANHNGQRNLSYLTIEVRSVRTRRHHNALSLIFKTAIHYTYGSHPAPLYIDCLAAPSAAHPQLALPPKRRSRPVSSPSPPTHTHTQPCPDDMPLSLC
eukprot:scaffold58326_cov56-Phaeocystis_antarctica.AAC.2